MGANTAVFAKPCEEHSAWRGHRKGPPHQAAERLQLTLHPPTTIPKFPFLWWEQLHRTVTKEEALTRATRAQTIALLFSFP